MNFSQLHERVRIEVLRRIENGSLNATLLAHQVDCSPAHISNFLRRRRRLSIDALDKVLLAQSLTIAELYSEGRYPQLPGGRADGGPGLRLGSSDRAVELPLRASASPQVRSLTW